MKNDVRAEETTNLSEGLSDFNYKRHELSFIKYEGILVTYRRSLLLSLRTAIKNCEVDRIKINKIKMGFGSYHKLKKEVQNATEYSVSLKAEIFKEFMVYGKKIEIDHYMAGNKFLIVCDFSK